MCGIAGFVKKNESILNDKGVKKILNHLYSFSENRGHDSSGIAVVRGNKIQVNKRAIAASKYIKSSVYSDLLKDESSIQAVVAHARMETNGSFANSDNNQPVVKDGLVTIHNGIIVNDDDLWNKYSLLERNFRVDTEIFNSLFKHFDDKGLNIHDVITKTLESLKGSYSFATLFEKYNSLFLATNTGSLYYIKAPDFLVFASEYVFLESLVEKYLNDIDNIQIIQLKPGEHLFIDINDISIQRNKRSQKNREVEMIDILKVEKTKRYEDRDLSVREITDTRKYIENEYKERITRINNLKRCSRCVLPETMPFIEFDKDGICNYCHNYQKIDYRGKDGLEKILSKYRRKDDRPDCIMAFSGGRDSSYALHLMKKELGMNPVAYSYDWGMITDLGRRNQARMTGVLGVEHILVSADIQRKRENIRMNVNAWLKRPNLGTVPLFMAGDKQYFYHAQRLSKQMDLDLVVLSENLMEVTNFKTGFCGMRPKAIEGKKFYALSLSSMFRLMVFYGKEFILDPSYINRSLLDSIGAFASYYVIPHNLLSLFSYLPWHESEVENVLLNKYDWEIAQDTNTTWRIGDGTAAFYNYIYYMIAGFSEIDTFRSNQIREGHITREEALKKIKEENHPRVESLIWYTNTIDVDLMNALKKINSVETLY